MRQSFKRLVGRAFDVGLATAVVILAFVAFSRIRAVLGGETADALSGEEFELIRDGETRLSLLVGEYKRDQDTVTLIGDGSFRETSVGIDDVRRTRGTWYHEQGVVFLHATEIKWFGWDWIDVDDWSRFEFVLIQGKLGLAPEWATSAEDKEWASLVRE